MSVDIVIVNYNGGDCLGQCLESLAQVIQSDTNVFIVDNASLDHSADAVESFDSRFHLIRLEKNLGFAMANNVGARMGAAEVIHFLNPDTKCHANMVDVYRCQLELEPEILYVTGVYSEDGKKYPGLHTIPFVKDLLYLSLGKRDRVRKWAQGSSLILTRLFFEKLGGWPEDYFMYAEDLDFSWRANLLGKGVKELKYSVQHSGEGVTSKVWSSYERECRKQRSTWKFFKKYHRRLDYFLVSILHFFGGIFRNPSGAIKVLHAKLSIHLMRNPL